MAERCENCGTAVDVLPEQVRPSFALPEAGYPAEVDEIPGATVYRPHTPQRCRAFRAANGEAAR